MLSRDFLKLWTFLQHSWSWFSPKFMSGSFLEQKEQPWRASSLQLCHAESWNNGTAKVQHELPPLALINLTWGVGVLRAALEPLGLTKPGSLSKKHRGERPFKKQNEWTPSLKPPFPSFTGQGLLKSKPLEWTPSSKPPFPSWNGDFCPFLLLCPVRTQQGSATRGHTPWQKPWAVLLEIIRHKCGLLIGDFFG